MSSAEGSSSNRDTPQQRQQPSPVKRRWTTLSAEYAADEEKTKLALMEMSADDDDGKRRLLKVAVRRAQMQRWQPMTSENAAFGDKIALKQLLDENAATRASSHSLQTDVGLREASPMLCVFEVRPEFAQLLMASGGGEWIFVSRSPKEATMEKAEEEEADVCRGAGKMHLIDPNMVCIKDHTYIYPSLRPSPDPYQWEQQQQQNVEEGGCASTGDGCSELASMINRLQIPEKERGERRTIQRRTPQNARRRRSKHQQKLKHYFCAGNDDRRKALLHRFIKCIYKAKRRIRIFVYILSSESITEALIDANERGVDVKVLVNYEQMYNRNWGRVNVNKDVQRLLDANISVDVDAVGTRREGDKIWVGRGFGSIMHVKAMMIDNRLTVHGSANHSDKAFNSNIECLCFDPTRSTNLFFNRWFNKRRREAVSASEFEAMVTRR